MKWLVIICAALALTAEAKETKTLRCEGNATPSKLCTNCRYCAYCSGKENTATCSACHERKLKEEAVRRAAKQNALPTGRTEAGRKFNGSFKEDQLPKPGQ